MIKELWKDLPDWEGFYQVSNCGRVKSVTRSVWVSDNSQGKGYYRTYNERIIKPKLERNGYYRLTLWRNRQCKTYSVHVLVAITWLNYAPTSNLCINHKNGIKTDNFFKNLEITTYKENMQHALTTGLRKVGFDSKCAVLTRKDGLEILKLRNEGKTLRKIANLYKASKRAVENALKWTIQESNSI